MPVDTSVICHEHGSCYHPILVSSCEFTFSVLEDEFDGTFQRRILPFRIMLCGGALSFQLVLRIEPSCEIISSWSFLAFYSILRWI